ncbi:uncharacterized protein LOC123293243 isoform X2 [Chrysoperla carnea]|uniref:uncharacterized protein LOC123293243 isoform X2 n=1 Tax=Chrysoperla carnea TaxID=189513 RepID=UPI001D066BD0|nr:uncharacterized protein LOC123293243 isoform X2 [Chrysoperla carnea]
MSSSQQVNIKEERQDEAEIRELADKILEANKAKMAAANARPAVGPGTQQTNQVGGNILGFLTRKGVPAQRPATAVEDKKDDDFGKFGWITLGKAHIPYIFRQGEKYCAVRMVEQKVLNKYLNYLHQDIYSCTCIRSYYIAEMESKLLSEINARHCDLGFGREPFTVRDLVVRVNDAIEFYNFLDVCYNKLIRGTCGPKDRCGFIRINKESVVPYTVRGDSKYVPLFYFEGETDNLKLKADELEGWDLSYLKFCCKVQGIRNELFANETCAVISLNDIKSYFPPGTEFEDYWPSKVVDSQLLVASKGGGQNGLWTRQPAAPPPVVPKPPVQTRRSPAPAAQASAPLGLTQMQQAVLNANGWAAGLVNQSNLYNTNSAAANQLIRQVSLGMQGLGNVPSTQSQAQSRNNQRSHQYYPQNNIPMTLSSAQIPPPLVRSTVAPNTLGATGTYTTPSLLPQSVSQSYNMMASLAEHGLMPPPVNAANYASAVQQQASRSHQVQQQQQQNARSASQNNRSVLQAQTRQTQQQQQQQQQMTRSNMSRSRQEPQQHPPPLIPVNGSAAALNPTIARYSTPTSNSTPGSEVIDLSSSPRTSTQQRQVVGNGRTTVMDGGHKLTMLPDTPSQGSHMPFKVQKALVEGIMVPCINMKPYVYSELLITLPDLVAHFFPKHSVPTIKQVLEVLGMELFKGNQQQMQILRESGKCQSIHDVLPLVQIREIMNYMPQIKYMCKGNEEINQAKRQRTS